MDKLDVYLGMLVRVKFIMEYKVGGLFLKEFIYKCFEFYFKGRFLSYGFWKEGY